MTHDVNHIRKVKEAHEADLLSRPGVTGIDIGYKYVGGRKTDEIAIRVHVQQKGPVRPEHQIPATIGGITTDVVQTQFKAVGDDKMYSILQGGISVGAANGNLMGTLGALGIDNATGTRLLLTNYHVLCQRDGTWRESGFATQPGLSGAVVGPLTRGLFEGGSTAAEAGVVDAALAGIGGVGLVSPRQHLNWITEIGPVAGGSDSTSGTLRKRGRTTELTSGTLEATDGTYQIDYRTSGLGYRWLKKQMKIAPSSGITAFADEGDSGSVVVNANNEVVGLIVAGSSDPTRPGVIKGIATPISSVLVGTNLSLAITGLFADSAGWNQPQYYSTIQTVAYNNQLLLLARGAGDGGLQVYQWDEQDQRFHLLKSTGLFNDASGWNQPQYYSTIQTVVYNNQLLLLARSAGDGGLQMYQWDTAHQQFVFVKSTGLFSDANGWNQPQYYSTIQTVAYNNQLLLLARGAGDAGLQVYAWDGAQFLVVKSTGLFSDANGWNQPQYYSTIQTVVYNNQLLLFARGAGDGGLQVYQWDTAQQQFVFVKSTGLFSDSNGWNQRQYYSTIQTLVDLSTNRLLMLARGAGDGGLQIYEWDSTLRQFAFVTATGLFNDANGWNQPQYYSTIQTIQGTGNNRLLLLARSAGETGLLTYRWDGVRAFLPFTFGNAPVVAGLFSDAGGWNQPQYYSTIQNVAYNDQVLLLARGAGDGGLQVYQWAGAQSQFTSVGSTGLFKDANGWNQPQYYSTIQTVVYNTQLLLLARGAGDGGLQVYQWDTAQRQFVFVKATGLFSDANGWNQPQYYSTIQTVVYNNQLLLLARGAGDGGLQVYQWDTAQQQFVFVKSTGLFNDANGWNQPQYYSTIQTVAYNDQVLLLARGAGDGGLQVYQWDGAQFVFVKSTGLFSDANGWNQPQYHSTIQTVVSSGQLLLLARGAGDGGLQVYEWDMGQRQFTSLCSTGLFTDAGGWNQPQYYSTIQTATPIAQGLLLAREAGDGGLMAYLWNPATSKFTLISAYNRAVTGKFFHGYSELAMGLFCRGLRLDWPES